MEESIIIAVSTKFLPIQPKDSYKKLCEDCGITLFVSNKMKNIPNKHKYVCLECSDPYTEDTENNEVQFSLEFLKKIKKLAKEKEIINSN